MKNNYSETESTPEQHHQRQTFFEIWLPIFIALIFCLGVAILAIIASDNTNAIYKWTDISIIFMIVPMFFFFLINIVLIFLAIRTISGLNHKLPPFFEKSRTITYRLSSRVQSISYLAIIPVLKIRTWDAGIRSFMLSIKPRKN